MIPIYPLSVFILSIIGYKLAKKSFSTFISPLQRDKLYNEYAEFKIILEIVHKISILL